MVTKSYLAPIVKDKDPSINVKMHQTFFFVFLPPFILYLLSGWDLFNMFSPSLLSLMTSLDILCSNTRNLKDKIAKIFVTH